MEKYVPKVGEECLALKGQKWLKSKILYCGNNGQFDVFACMEISDISSSGLLFWSADFKPLPTEEDELKDELLSLMNNMAVTRDSLKPHDFADKIIKAGYRKVNPIHKDEFTRLYYEYDPEDLFTFLVKNNHILTK